MNTFKPLVLLLALAALFAAAPPASARSSVSFDFFYNNLDPYGEWVEVPDYGYCWHPTGVGEDWAPYTDGYWAYTDGGWTWVSYEDFGGITYHYGRWVQLDDEGWCWVPDYEWAPAWVSWRSSDDYVGWAPLPPRARFRHDIGISISVDSDYDIGPSHYNFCEVGHFGDPALRPVIIDRSRNVNIINRTTNITNITVNRTTNNVFVGGPQFRTISARTARPIQVLRLRRETDAAAIRAAGGKTLARQQGNQLVVLAPEVAKSETQIKPSKVARTIGSPKVNQGWNGVTDPQAKEQLQTKIRGEHKGREHAAAKPVLAEDLKIVDEKAKATKEPATPASPTEVLPTGRGKNKKGAPAVANELIAQPNAPAAPSPAGEVKTGRGKKAKNGAAIPPVSAETQTAVPAPTAAPRGKGKKTETGLTAQPAPTAPETSRDKKRGPRENQLQPFSAQPEATTTAPASVLKKSKRDVPSAEQNAAKEQRAAAVAAQVEQRQRELAQQRQQAAEAQTVRARKIEERQTAVQQSRENQAAALEASRARRLQERAAAVPRAEPPRSRAVQPVPRVPVPQAVAPQAAVKKDKKKGKDEENKDQH